MTELTRHTEIEARAIARSIADELRARPDHWMRGAMWRKDGSDRIVTEKEADVLCLMGHIFKRCGDRKSAPVVELFERHLSRPIADWNDARGRTVEQVVALCERVAHVSDEQKGGL
jgi:hypothetical protein